MTTETIEYDIRGQICPSTLLVALREINAHEAALRERGLRLRFRTDNRECLRTIPDSVRTMGFAVEVVRDPGCYVIEVSGE